MIFQILSASLYIAEHLPDGADGLWALVNAASWCALGELEWVPFSVIRRATDINLLGKFSKNILMTSNRRNSHYF